MSESANAIDIAIGLCKQFEGCRLSAYWDAAGERWTIGYGCTGPGILEGAHWTQQRAETELRQRVNQVHDAALQASPILHYASQQRQAAITDFVYNCGIGAYRSSTLKTCIDAGDWEEARHEIVKWSRANGKVLAGLVARRESEEQLLAAV